MHKRLNNYILVIYARKHVSCREKEVSHILCQLQLLNVNFILRVERIVTYFIKIFVDIKDEDRYLLKNPPTLSYFYLNWIFM